MILDFWTTHAFKHKLEIAIYCYDYILSDLQKDHNNKIHTLQYQN